MDHGQLSASGSYLNLVTSHNEVGWNIHRSAVHKKVPVTDKLSGSRTGRSETQPKDNIVQSPFKELQQVYARFSLNLFRLSKIPSELILQKTVGVLHLLLLTKLEAIVRQSTSPSLSMLSGPVVFPFQDSTYLGISKDIFAKLPGYLGFRSPVPGHVSSSPS